jgi:hypothetical protein
MLAMVNRASAAVTFARPIVVMTAVVPVAVVAVVAVDRVSNGAAEAEQHAQRQQHNAQGEPSMHGHFSS